MLAVLIPQTTYDDLTRSAEGLGD